MSENPFRAALEWWGPNGERWSHSGAGTYVSEEDRYSSLCSANALNELAHHEDTEEAHLLLREVVAAQFPDRRLNPKHGVVPGFNDHPDTTFDDVRTVFEKAALRWDEQQAFGDSTLSGEDA